MTERFKASVHLVFIVLIMIYVIRPVSIKEDTGNYHKISEYPVPIAGSVREMYDVLKEPVIIQEINFDSVEWEHQEEEVQTRWFDYEPTEQEIYELSELIECEAGIESLDCKVAIGSVVMNRVMSNKFPDTIHDVIYQKRAGIYQFSPLKQGGSWGKLEPGEESKQAVEIILNSESDITYGSLYFDWEGSSNVWHDGNNYLQFVVKYDRTNFYKETK